MKVPYLKKKPEIKSCHNIEWEDNYSWIHQKNILEVLKDSSKLMPEVRKYLEEENYYTEFNLSDTKDIQKKLFKIIKKKEFQKFKKILPSNISDITNLNYYVRLKIDENNI